MKMNSGWTGERMETDILSAATIEHLHRYAIASDLVKNKTVLDIASGEGYGSWILASHALKVVGVDISGSVVKNAEKKYKASNLQFLTGSVTSIPFENESFDVVVSFETLEHIEDHHGMLSEIKRVLRPKGIVLISTPDKKYYSDESGYKNPFHKNELYRDEFISLINQYFRHSVFLGQRFVEGSFIFDESINPVLELNRGDFSGFEKSAPPPALFMIAVASDERIENIPSSVFYNEEISKKIREAEINEVRSSVSYKLGHAILWPAKFVRSLFRS